MWIGSLFHPDEWWPSPSLWRCLSKRPFLPFIKSSSPSPTATSSFRRMIMPVDCQDRLNSANCFSFSLFSLVLWCFGGAVRQQAWEFCLKYANWKMNDSFCLNQREIGRMLQNKHFSHLDQGGWQNFPLHHCYPLWWPSAAGSGTPSYFPSVQSRGLILKALCWRKVFVHKCGLILWISLIFEADFAGGCLNLKKKKKNSLGGSTYVLTDHNSSCNASLKTVPYIMQKNAYCQMWSLLLSYWFLLFENAYAVFQIKFSKTIDNWLQPLITAIKTNYLFFLHLKEVIAGL